MICTNCFYQGKPKTITKGSLGMEILLWVFFFWMWFIPGIIYTLWRLSTQKKVCKSCEQDTLVSTKSPRGSEIIERLSAKA